MFKFRKRGSSGGQYATCDRLMKFLKIKLKFNNKLKQIFNYPIKISLNYDVIKVLFILFQTRKILFIRNPKPIKKRKNEKKKKTSRHVRLCEWCDTSHTT